MDFLKASPSMLALLPWGMNRLSKSFSNLRLVGEGGPWPDGDEFAFRQGREDFRAVAEMQVRICF